MSSEPHDSGGTSFAERAERLDSALEILRELKAAEDAGSGAELRDFASLLVQLAELADLGDDVSHTLDACDHPIAELILEGAEAVKAAADDDPEAFERIGQLRSAAEDRWGDQLSGVTEQPFDAIDGGWTASPEFDDDVLEEHGDEQVQVPSAEQLSQLLANLGASEPGRQEPSGGSAGEASPIDPTPRAAPPDQAGSVAGSTGDAALAEDPVIAGELREAFLDDAGRCVASLEEALLTLESRPEDVSSLRQILRELHTLKGASGSVGLAALASFIHELEETLRVCEAEQQAPDVESLLEKVDAIRRRVDSIRNPNRSAPANRAGGSTDGQAGGSSTAASPRPSGQPTHFDEGPADDETVRVKTSQLNRLMDMLSQLVMLRNRRGMELADLEQIHHELIHSVSRIRLLGDPSLRAEPIGPKTDDSQAVPRIDEIAGDLLETAQRLRDCYRPVSEGNAAVSQFIRQFRQELLELRRTPVSGLFRRLRRSIRDAARSEGKQVELSLVGEETGIERSLQEKIYEPLLHIVRNGVSHGIESPDDRAARGKPPAGQVTLAAHSGPDLLVIEVRDDGRGLDYDAIRRRGVERGLLKPDMAPSREELAQLIFQPGFSTREVASEIAGRGVGMDIVAATLERMRGWVQVESIPEQGTTIRLNFPLPSVIQHTMVFRSSGQLFALPMQFVRGAGGDVDELPVTPFDELLVDLASSRRGAADGAAKSDPAAKTAASKTWVILDCQTKAESMESDIPGSPGRRVALTVDEIIGPEEVVVRPLPALLKQHPLLTGATLSGTGEIVLVLDPHRLGGLVARGAERSIRSASRPTPTTNPPTRPRPRVLVTDDSLTARKRLVQSLLRYDVEIVEATDGSEAWQRLQNDSFAAVFSDFEMPRLDGLALLAEIRQRWSQDELPVVIVSSRTEAEYRQRAAELGVDAYLGKPIEDETLDRAIANHSTLSRTLTPCTSPTSGQGEIE